MPRIRTVRSADGRPTHRRAGRAARILERLRRLGFAVEPAQLATPAALAALAVHRRRANARRAGHERSAFGYDVLNRAFRLVMDGAELVALQRNRYWLTPDGLSLDVGPFVAALEYATGTTAHVVGKPAPAFFETILQTAGAPAAEAAMVGDDIESDVGGAQRAGLAGILVRTGKFREDALRASGIRPDAIVDSIAAVPALLGR